MNEWMDEWMNEWMNECFYHFPEVLCAEFKPDPSTFLCEWITYLFSLRRICAWSVHHQSLWTTTTLHWHIWWASWCHADGAVYSCDVQQVTLSKLLNEWKETIIYCLVWKKGVKVCYKLHVLWISYTLVVSEPVNTWEIDDWGGGGHPCGRCAHLEVMRNRHTYKW